MSTRKYKYNPAFLTDDEHLSTFIVRQHELRMILQTIRENTRQSNQHLLLIGPRGIGKTTLVLRVVAEIRKYSELNRNWYPIVFSEESYEVGTPGEFWLEALFHLSKQTKEKRWKRIYVELKEEMDDDRLNARALAQLMDFADAIGKRILIIVENFNMLLGDQLSDQDAWTIRHTMLNEPRLMLLATATSWIDHMQNSGKAMFEVFKAHDLKPLDEEECRKLWTAQTGKEPIQERVRPIQILTGGNPRLVTIIANFATDLSLKLLMDDLMQLVDDHTDYFKSRLDNMAPVERKIYLALAEIWDPAPASEVAKQARLNVNKASSLLNRLINRGAVVVTEKKGRTKYYQIAERLYNIYYLMRRRGAPSRRVRAIVNFMVSFYEPKELVTTAHHIAQEACELGSNDCELHYLVYGEIFDRIEKHPVKEAIIQNTPKAVFKSDLIPANIMNFTVKPEATINRNAEITSKDDDNYLDKRFKEILDLVKDPDKVPQAEKTLKRLIDDRSESPKAWTIWGWFNEFHLKRYNEAERSHRKAIEIDPEYIGAWAKLGQLLHERMERFEEAEKVYRKLIELDPKHSWSWAQLGQLLHERMERFEEAETAYRKAIEIDPEYKWAWAKLGQLLHERMERFEEAEKVYRKLIELDPKHSWSWAQLGQLLHERMERFEEAETAYRKAIEIDPKAFRDWDKLLKIKTLTGSHSISDIYKIAETTINRFPDDANLINSISWGFVRYAPLSLIIKIEQWARKAVALEPEYTHIRHTLAAVLLAVGKTDDAISQCEYFLSDKELVQKDTEEVIDIILGIAAAGKAGDALSVVQKSSSAEFLEPLIVGLKLYLGEKVRVAREILEVGKDVCSRIEKKIVELEKRQKN